ncbi:PEP-utilizing enzyme [Curtobacterium sp. RRHDQ10]|uniref:PEP-utilizing enzyme n=1 Tax=Curtobacterium phyllosphaerae TaxID=3413379 RepID=UPI003BF3DC53
MSQQIADHDTTFEQVGTGLTVYETDEVVEGVVKWLETPEDVIAFVADDADVSDVVVISRGGTTTFLTMALNAGVRGVVTLQGAPESHLGILCREYGIPAVMSVAFDKGVRTGRGETIPADGVRIRLDVRERPQGTVSVETGAPVDDSPAPESAAPAMSEEQLAQIMLLLEKFGGVVPKGLEGDRIMQEKMTTKVLFVDDDALPDLTREEVNDAIGYYTWNEWDALASRATEGESGLIPRQEYEAMGLMNCWFMHPKWLRAIEDRVGKQGVIDIASVAKREIGTKVNMLHIWAMATAPSFGRGIALELNLHEEDYKGDRIRDAFGVVRRMYKGFWGNGPILTSMKGYQAEVLDRDWIDRFTEDRLSLAADADRSTFQRFQGASELMGFLLHFDNRLGVSDHGPYPTDDGGFVLVRDIFLNEPAWHWNDPASPLPWSVTTAMFFGPDSGLDVQVVDISTVFTKPANYVPYITHVAAYSRPTWDAPMSDVVALDLDDMNRIRTQAEQQSAALYGRIATMDKREKIEAGAMTYTAGFALPFARAAGMVDELTEHHDFLDIHPAVAACYDTIVAGLATEMIPRLFLTGSWAHQVSEHTTDDIASDGAEFTVLQALRVRGFATTEQIVESTGLSEAVIDATLAGTDERGHTQVTGGKRALHALTPAGRARSVLLADDRLAKADRATITGVYESFLFPNRDFKQLITDAQGGASVDALLDSVHEQIGGVLTELVAVDPRFDRYRDRFEAAIAGFRSGDRDALARPLSGSYHDVWMELHEDLIATLGRVRTDDDE